MLSMVKWLLQSLTPDGPLDTINTTTQDALLQPLAAPSSNTAVVATWTGILPPEIMLFHIIDHELHDNIPALQNLALTCRFIHPHVQKHLFHSVSIPATPLPTAAHTIPTPQIVRFLTTLHQRPDILSHIQRLTITVMAAVSTNAEDTTSSAYRSARHETECLYFIMGQAFPALSEFHLVFDAAWIGSVKLFPWGEIKNAVVGLLGRCPRLGQVTVQPAGFIASSLLRHAVSEAKEAGVVPVVDSELMGDTERGELNVSRPGLRSAGD